MKPPFSLLLWRKQRWAVDSFTCVNWMLKLVVCEISSPYSYLKVRNRSLRFLWPRTGPQTVEPKSDFISSLFLIILCYLITCEKLTLSLQSIKSKKNWSQKNLHDLSLSWKTKDFFTKYSSKLNTVLKHRWYEMRIKLNCWFSYNRQVHVKNLNFVAGMMRRFVSAKRLIRYFSTSSKLVEHRRS